jgi:NAD(P)-dependent dehydrogenase (short-subunit alcohol dehydrogenase family)
VYLGLEHLVEAWRVIDLFPKGITALTVLPPTATTKLVAKADLRAWNPGSMWAWTSDEGKTAYYLPNFLRTLDGGALEFGTSG